MKNQKKYRLPIIKIKKHVFPKNIGKLEKQLGAKKVNKKLKNMYFVKIKTTKNIKNYFFKKNSCNH